MDLYFLTVTPCRIVQESALEDVPQLKIVVTIIAGVAPQNPNHSPGCDAECLSDYLRNRDQIRGHAKEETFLTVNEVTGIVKEREEACRQKSIGTNRRQFVNNHSTEFRTTRNFFPTNCKQHHYSFNWMKLIMGGFSLDDTLTVSH